MGWTYMGGGRVLRGVYNIKGRIAEWRENKCVKGGAEEGRKEAGKGERRRGGQKPKQRSVNRASVEHQRSLNDCWTPPTRTRTRTHMHMYTSPHTCTHTPCWMHLSVRTRKDVREVENNTQGWKMNKSMK